MSLIHAAAFSKVIFTLRSLLILIKMNYQCAIPSLRNSFFKNIYLLTTFIPLLVTPIDFIILNLIFKILEYRLEYKNEHQPTLSVELMHQTLIIFPFGYKDSIYYTF